MRVQDLFTEDQLKKWLAAQGVSNHNQRRSLCVQLRKVEGPKSIEQLLIDAIKSSTYYTAGGGEPLVQELATKLAKEIKTMSNSTSHENEGGSWKKWAAVVALILGIGAAAWWYFSKDEAPASGQKAGAVHTAARAECPGGSVQKCIDVEFKEMVDEYDLRQQIDDCLFTEDEARALIRRSCEEVCNSAEVIDPPSKKIEKKDSGADAGPKPDAGTKVTGA